MSSTPRTTMLLPLLRIVWISSVFAAGLGDRETDRGDRFIAHEETRRLESTSPTVMVEPSSPPSVLASVSPTSQLQGSSSAAPTATLAASSEAPSATPEVESEAPSASPPPVAVMQRAALESFASAMGADKSRFLDDWFDDDRSYCDYTGIGCDSDGYVITLDLDQTALSGVLPESVGDLTRLRRFKALKNDIHGPLPISLATLPDLRQLNLGRNQLTGPLPNVSEAGMFPRLRRLHLHSNNLSGTIPASLCNLQTLDALDISNNPLILGELPACFGDMEELTTLRIRDLGLVGQVPEGLCGLRQLNEQMNNTFGCDAIACGAGFYEPAEGRQLTNETPCLECKVPSNVIGSTTCVELDGNEVITGAPTASPAPSQSPTTSVAPTSTPLPTEAPSVKPSTAPSASPTVSMEPTLEPSFAPSTAPSSSPSLAPSGRPNVADDTASPSAVKITQSPTDPAPQFESFAPSSSPTRAFNVGGINDGVSGGGSSRNIATPLLISFSVLAAVLCILAFLVIRRQRRRVQEAFMEEEESVSGGGPGSPNDPPMSMADSVSYLYDLEDGNTTDQDVGSRMTDLDDISEIDGGYEVERTTGGGGFGKNSYAMDSKTRSPNVFSEDESNGGGKNVASDLSSGLLSPSRVLPRSILKRSTRSDSPKEGPILLSPEGKEESTKPYPIVLSPEGKKNSNPWLGDKEKSKSKLGIYGSLFRSNSDLSNSSSHISVNTNTPILGAAAKQSDAKSVASNTDSESDDGHDLLGPECNAFTIGNIREKLGLTRCTSA